MIGNVEWGKCEICGKEGPLERTYFYYNINCECCGNKEGWHFELVKHCCDCPARMPRDIHPLIKAQDGNSYKTNITNILPIDIRGKFIL